MKPDFILAQISDLHIKRDAKLAYGRVDTVAALNRAIDCINAFSPRIDAVLISGDLTDFGFHEDCEQLKELLQRLTVAYYLVPGNHDQREPLREVFSEQPFPVEGPLNWTVDTEFCRLIGLDSLVEKKPYGELAQETLAYLDAQLKSSDKPTFVSFHHPPVSVGIDHMDVQNLQNASEVEDIIASYPHVAGVLCGHLHRYVVTQWANTQLIICPGTSHSVTMDLAEEAAPSFSMEPPAMLLHCVFGQRVITHSVFLSDFDGPYPFFNSDGSLID